MHDPARRSFSRATLTVACLAWVFSLEAQPRIDHDSVDCLSRESFTRLVATIEPPETIRAAKVYFRSNLYPEFYFVAMSRGAASGFEAVLPLPGEETSRVVYYIEAVDSSFQTGRSEELEASVPRESSCRPGPGGALFPGGNPGIVVGSTRTGIAALPPGFQASGITGFVSATGTIGSVGGGIGAGVAIGAAAGAAAGVGVIVSSAGGNGNGGGGNTTSVVAGTSSAPPSTSSPSTTTVTGAPSTTTTTIAGTPLPPSTTTTTITTNTTTAPVTLTACFQWQALGSCLVFFESCSTPESSITRYEWRMLGPPVPDPPLSPSFTFNFEADPRCLGTMDFNRPVRHTVFDEFGRSASVQENVSVRPAAAYRTESAPLSFTSRVVKTSSDASARVQLLVNGAPLPPTDSSSPARHQILVEAGTVRIEATFATPLAPSSLLELDFSSCERAIPGSLEAEAGLVATSADRRIVFRLSGDGGEVIRLRLQVR